jgi:hypothetical protein
MDKIQNPSNQFGIVPLSYFVPMGLGFVHHSIAFLYHEVPRTYLTIRDSFIAVGGGAGRAQQGGVPQRRRERVREGDAAPQDAGGARQHAHHGRDPQDTAREAERGALQSLRMAVRLRLARVWVLAAV